MLQYVNGTTGLYGLIGNPVSHTRSPLIHNFLAQELGHNLVYLPFHVKSNLKEAIAGASALNILGCNVTVPYKNEVLSYLDEVDENAARIGAVNTLVRMDCGYKGYNTDYLGLHRAMQEEHIPIKDQHIIILGAGGSAMAAVYLCASEGAKEIHILNRTPENAKKIAASVHRYYPNVLIHAISMNDYTALCVKSYVAIQTTTVGLHPDNDHAVIEDVNFYHNISHGMDLIFNPSETKFMRLLKEQGRIACNGLKMLLYQGILAYELWNHVQVPDGLIKELLTKLREEPETHE